MINDCYNIHCVCILRILGSVEGLLSEYPKTWPEFLRRCDRDSCRALSGRSSPLLEALRGSLATLLQKRGSKKQVTRSYCVTFVNPFSNIGK